MHQVGHAAPQQAQAGSSAGAGPETPKPVRSRYWRLLTHFAAASVVATAISQLTFVVSYAVGAPAVVATVIAWLAGAIPNFVLNRRTWRRARGGGQGTLRREAASYAAISVGTALLAALATSGAESLARTDFAGSRPLQVAVVWGAFCGTYAVMFVVKFVLVDRLVFTAGRQPQRRPRERAR